MKTMAKRIYDWADERLRLHELQAFMEKKHVPMHRGSIWYYFGGVTLFLFIIQVVTGILLLLYYKGGEQLAFESIQFLMSKVSFGWLIRSIHSWAANLFILSAVIHMFSVFFERAYRKPREITWLTGMVMLFIGMGFGFSGYLLPWNELAFFATKVGTDIAGVVPVIGKPLMIFLRGGEDVTGATLTRFFGFHVAVLPGVFTVLLSIHLLLVQRQGMSEPLAVARESSVRLIDEAISGGKLIAVFTQPIFWKSIVNSFVYVGLTIAIGFLIPVFLALGLNEIPRAKVFFRTVFYLAEATFAGGDYPKAEENRIRC